MLNFGDPITMKLGQRPDGTLFSAGLVLVVCLLWTIILPGAVALHNGVFFCSGVVSHLSANSLALMTINEDQDEKRALIKELRELNGLISSATGQTSSAPLIKTLIDARDKTEEDLKNFKPRITVAGLYENAVNVVFLLNYLALACLVFMIPSDKYPISARRIFAIGLAAFFIYRWPNFLRNLIFNQYLGESYERGRTIFATLNWDIDPASFILQETRVFGMIMLLSVLWQRWSLYAAKIYVCTRGGFGFDHNH